GRVEAGCGAGTGSAAGVGTGRGPRQGGRGRAEISGIRPGRGARGGGRISRADTAASRCGADRCAGGAPAADRAVPARVRATDRSTSHLPHTTWSAQAPTAPTIRGGQVSTVAAVPLAATAARRAGTVQAGPARRGAG